MLPQEILFQSLSLNCILSTDLVRLQRFHHSSFNLCLQFRLWGIYILMIGKKKIFLSSKLIYFVGNFISSVSTKQGDFSFLQIRAQEYTNEKMCQLQLLSSELLWNNFPWTSIFKNTDDFKQRSELSRGICKMFSPRKSKAGDLCFSNPMINKELWLKIYIYININIGVMLKSCHAVESRTWLAVWRGFQGVLQSLFIFPDLPEKKGSEGRFCVQESSISQGGWVGMSRCCSGCSVPVPCSGLIIQQGNGSSTESQSQSKAQSWSWIENIWGILILS